MQKVKIPITIDPVKAAQKRSDYYGVVPLVNLTRLTENLLSTQGDVTVNLACGTDPQGLTVLTGSAGCTVTVSCERCQEPMQLVLESSFTYTPIRAGDTEAPELIPESYDVIEKDEHGEINLRQLVEDELILMLPLFPMHDEAACAVDSASMSWGKIEPESEKPNPFAILQELKKK